MEVLGQGGSPLIAPRARLFAAATVLLVGAGVLAAWPFAIDDAWISVRYARHLAHGLGYVWNAGATATDGVTPLPWAFLLAPLARAAPMAVLTSAKLLGVLAWALGAFAWGVAVGRLDRPTWAKGSALAILALSVPLAAHAVSGMETGVAIALVTLASVSHARPRLAAALSGLAAAFRPELGPWALVLGVGFAMLARGPAGLRATTWFAGSLALLPFALCVVIRLVAFGHPAPLSVLAKPSDLAHGFTYLGAAFVFCLAPVLLLAPRALAKERGPGLVLALAALAHCGAIAVVGGDWMPYARLMAPIVPSMLYAFVCVSAYGRPRLHQARVVVALLLGLLFAQQNLGRLRMAGADRRALIEAAPALLAREEPHVIGAVDIGWVSAAFEGTIVDLAGVTDPEVAALGGGHTSKRVDTAFLLGRGVDVLVFYSDRLPETLTDVTSESFPRVVEARLVASSAFRERFVASSVIPLGAGGAGYVVFRRR